MRLDTFIRDLKQTVQNILRALDNNLKAEHNFAPDGDEDDILCSNGPGHPPSWKPGGGPAGGAGKNNPFIVSSSAPSLPNSHVLVAGDGVDLTTVGGSIIISVDDDSVQPVEGISNISYDNPMGLGTDIVTDGQDAIVFEYGIPLGHILSVAGRLVVIS